MLKLWNHTDGLTMANGMPYTPEQVIADFPFASSGDIVLEIVGGRTVAVDSLDMLTEIYHIDTTLDKAAQLAAIEAAREEARNPKPAGDSAADIAEIKAILSGEVE